MRHMDFESIEKVRQYALHKFFEIFDGEYELPKYQSMDGIETEYISQNIDTREFVDQGIFGILDREEDDLLELLDPMEMFYEKLQHAKKKFSKSIQVKELNKIIEIVERKIDRLKHLLDSKNS